MPYQSYMYCPYTVFGGKSAFIQSSITSQPWHLLLKIFGELWPKSWLFGWIPFQLSIVNLFFSPFLHQTLPPGCDPAVTVLAQSVDCPTWWRHQMETFSALLALCAGNSPVTGEFPSQRPVTRSFGVFFDLRLKKRLSKRTWCWWF